MNEEERNDLTLQIRALRQLANGYKALFEAAERELHREKCIRRRLTVLSRKQGRTIEALQKKLGKIRDFTEQYACKK